MILNLDPYVFQVGPLAVRWYGLFMAIAILLGTYYLYREGMRRGLSEDFLLNLAILTVVGGVVGARLAFVLVNYPEWLIRDPLQVLKIYEGGLAWHGGLLGGLVVGWWYCRRHGLSLNALADLAVPGLATGYMLVRIGNIFNQELLGRLTELGFDRWPAQVVGSFIGLVLLVRYFTLARSGENLPAGYQFWSFILYHQLLRGAVEETVREMPLLWPLLESNRWGIGLFSAAQLVTPVIMLLAYYMIRLARAGRFDLQTRPKKPAGKKGHPTSRIGGR